MSVIKKPDLKIFAQDAKTGEIETFPDVLRGWGITLDRTAGKPPLEWFNAIGKRVDEWLMYLTQRGVAEWDAALSYPKTAIVQWNGVIYVSNKETKGEQPDKSQAAWSTLGVFLGLGNYYTKTDTDTKFQLKGNYALKGESYTKVESDTRFQPKGNYLPSGYSYSKSESDTKYQPKGNYAPAGDYATNTALKSGLDGKLNTNYPAAIGDLKLTKSSEYVGVELRKNSMERVVIETLEDSSFGALNIIYRDKDAKNVSVVTIPKRSGTAMLVGDYGVGVSLPQSIENNTATTLGCGFYAIPGNAGNPWGNNGSAHIINVRDGNYGFQIGRTTGNKNLSFRILSANVFSPPSVLYSTGNTTKDHNGNLKVSGSSELSDCPVGAPIPWPQATAPSGYLICNGQAFNKTTYPLLTKAYPSGKLPDLRGEFIRGLDAGRNIDNGRVVLSFQRCATEHHKHISGWGEASNANAIFGKTVKNGYVGSASTDRDNYLFYTNDGSEFQGSNPNSTGIMANETRPRNIAFLYIVRAA
ncbi:histidine kinase [Providencia stuartii]|uniref:Carbohydrate binding domain protein n=1 Tax=Providencia stuartii ATCC 25827 TaxID=471874 RepID=A0AA86YZY3_PROST|nr:MULTISPECIES: tail fiber protein [Providencia]EDU59859.1 carbohydrate binding domain protein [Providencia stuartii ATCC 25827]MBS7783551.1 tail fiber protein [Providencia thailandensis]MTC83293.1 histidine kinase [Providencia stuartii]MTC93699.1 histidine kinase [Providencia stuartii]